MLHIAAMLAREAFKRITEKEPVQVSVSVSKKKKSVRKKDKAARAGS